MALTELVLFGGPGAIGTTPADFEFEAAGARLALADAPPPDPVDLGDSDSAAFGVVTGVMAIEFLRDDFFEARVEDGPTGALPLPRLRFLITSVLSDSGRTTPCSFKNSPQALQRGAPSGLRRQRGVVWVKQLVHVVGAPPSLGLVPPGLWGRDGAAELKPDCSPVSGGEFGDDWVRPCIACCNNPAVLGVEVVRGIFPRRGSFPRLRISLTEAAEPCVLPKLLGLQ